MYIVGPKIRSATPEDDPSNQPDVAGVHPQKQIWYLKSISVPARRHKGELSGLQLVV